MKILALSTLIATSSLIASTVKEPDYIYWGTGPLICPAYSNVSKGEYDIEPYIFSGFVYGNYGSNWSEISTKTLYQFYTAPLIQIGLTDNFNVSVTPQIYYQMQGDQSTFNTGDWPLEVYFTLLEENMNGKKPGLVFGIRANAPIGKYRNLNPANPLVYSTGSGSWKPTLTLTIGKEIHLHKHHFLVIRAFFGPTFRTKVHVKGFNTFGGGYETNGTASIGTSYDSIFAFEYSFSQQLVFAMDLEWIHNNKVTFQGFSGFTDKAHTKAAVNTVPSSEQIQISPSIEYNFNENFGVLAGIWFTVAGRNAQAFAIPTLAINILY